MGSYQVVGTTSIRWEIDVQAPSEEEAEEVAKEFWFDRGTWHHEDVEIDDLVEVEVD